MFIRELIYVNLDKLIMGKFIVWNHHEHHKQKVNPLFS